jgi:hypothetical protein
VFISTLATAITKSSPFESKPSLFLVFHQLDLLLLESMGQICSGQKGEKTKDTAVSGDLTAEDLAILGQQQQTQQQQLIHDELHEEGSLGILPNQSSAASLTGLQQTQSKSSTTTTATVTSAAEKERLKAFQQEQQRLDMIVAAADQGMISVRSTRGSTGYYDQGFAAALAQHLEQTTSFPESLPLRLPAAPSSESRNANDQGNCSAGGDPNTASSSSNSVYSRLSQPQWEGIVLGTQGNGLAGCGGENPQQFMDNVAESLLETTLPAKQHLFVGVKPMVENLL